MEPHRESRWIFWTSECPCNYKSCVCTCICMSFILLCNLILFPGVRVSAAPWFGCYLPQRCPRIIVSSLANTAFDYTHTLSSSITISSIIPLSTCIIIYTCVYLQPVPIHGTVYNISCDLSPFSCSLGGHCSLWDEQPDRTKRCHL